MPFDLKGFFADGGSEFWNHDVVDGYIKKFEELEFAIVDVREATGNDKGTAIIQCQADNGELFWVRPKGSREYRASLLESQIIDKLLTVRYQNLTEKGIPRFPVGIAIRDYE